MSVVFAVGLTACAPDNVQPVEPARQVVFVLLDAARADRFGADGYARDTTPNMDALAAEGVWFEKHFSQATATRDSLPILLYSRYFTRELFPMSSSVPFEDPRMLMRRLDDEAISLPRAFSTSGFLTAAISAHSWLRPETRFAEEFDELYDLSSTLSFPAEQGYPSGEDVVDEAIEWIAQNRHRDYFLYVHLMDTHFPHLPGPDTEYFLGEKPYQSARIGDRGVPADEHGDALSASDRRLMDALYDGSLRYADRQIGRLKDYLDENGLLSQTLIVITADHGENLLEVPGRFGHGWPWYDQVGRIPLLLYYPSKLQPQRVSTFSESVDVLPTVVDLMDLSLPAGKSADGVSQAGVAQGEGQPKDYAFALRGVRDSRFKALFLDPPDVLLAEDPEVPALKGELYDTEADPLEQSNLWDSEQDEVERLLLAYREQLTPSYVRAITALNHDQPDAPFAIASRDLTLNREVSTRPPGAEAVTLEDARGLWVRSTEWDVNWLLAGPQAPPLRVRFSIPNGEYRVTPHIRGNAILRFQSGERVELDGPDYELGTRPRGEAVDAGHVTITDQTFRAEIRPTGPEFFVLQMIGFEPLGTGSGEESADSGLLERLKSLGYIK